MKIVIQVTDDKGDSSSRTRNIDLTTNLSVTDIIYELDLKIDSLKEDDY